MKRIQVIASVCALLIGQFAMAQEKSNDGINPHSLRPIHESNVAYKVSLWRRVDLREKQNQPLFWKNGEITKFMLDGVKAGVLDAYDDDKLEKRITLDQFNERLFKKFDGGGMSKEEIAAGFGTTEDDGGWGSTPTTGATSTPSGATEDGWGDSPATTTKSGEGNSGSIFEKSANGGSTTNTDGSTTAQARQDGYEMFPSDFYILEIKEDWIFDRQRSRQYFDIQSITIKIPAENSVEGLEKTLATFKYKDLQAFFRSNPNAIWFNEANTASHINLADAFELRLFHGMIVKKSNSRDKYLDEEFNSPKEALQNSQKLEFDLIEWEHDLWEY